MPNNFLKNKYALNNFLKNKYALNNFLKNKYALNNFLKKFSCKPNIVGFYISSRPLNNQKDIIRYYLLPNSTAVNISN